MESYEGIPESDSYKYEHLHDFEQAGPMATARHDLGFTTGSTYSLDGTLVGWAEALASGRSGGSIAVWSTAVCDFLGCGNGLRWRIVDH